MRQISTYRIFSIVLALLTITITNHADRSLTQLTADKFGIYGNVVYVR